MDPLTKLAISQLPSEYQAAFQQDFQKRKRSVGTAYLLWLFLGFHYLYLGKIGIQIFFWLTAAGCGVWWLVDFFRVPGLVARENEDLARALLVQYKALAA